MKFSVYNLGCRVNLAETEKITDDLIRLGYTYQPMLAAQPSYTEETNYDETMAAEVAVVNTCTVTAQADKKSWRLIRRLAENENLEFLFITGCYSELEPNLAQKLAAYKVKTIIVPQRTKHQLATIVDKTVCSAYGYTYEVAEHKAKNDKFAAFKYSRAYVGALISSQERFYGHRRAIIKIQDGCNMFCSYCRIPYARGAPRSRAADNIVHQLTQLGKNGVQEIVLTGINLSAYHDKTKNLRFSQLLRNLLARVPAHMHIRLSSLEPHYLDDEFFACLSHPQLVPHLHLPLQGTSDRILKAMGRRYTLADYRAIIERIYKVNPNFILTTDIITGYPSETTAEFRAGIDFIRSCAFFKLHVFPFSYRPLSALDSASGQQFLATEQLAPAQIKTRSATLRELSAALEDAKYTQLAAIPQRFVLETPLQGDALQAFYEKEAFVIAKNFPHLPFMSQDTIDIGTSAKQAQPVPKQSFSAANLPFYVFSGTSEYYLKGNVIIPHQFFNKSTTAHPKQDMAANLLGKAIKVVLVESSRRLFAPLAAA